MELSSVKLCLRLRLAVPGKPGEGYDSYAGLNVSNKIVLALRYVPEEVDAKRRQELNRYAGLRYKAMLARERGAAAILFVTGPNSPECGELAALSSDSAGSSSGIIAVINHDERLAKLFSAAGKDLKSIQAQLDRKIHTRKAASFCRTSRCRSQRRSSTSERFDRNVIAVLPAAVGRGVLTAPRTGDDATRRAEDSAPYRSAQEYILVGAHYDHLGLARQARCCAQGKRTRFISARMTTRPEQRRCWNLRANWRAATCPGVSPGPDRATPVSETRRTPGALSRNIIFALWSGEELGLIGSSHFVEHSRAAEQTSWRASTSIWWDGCATTSSCCKASAPRRRGGARSRTQRRRGLQSRVAGRSYLPTDVTAFLSAWRSRSEFFTGSHDDYHRQRTRRRRSTTTGWNAS